VVGVQSAALRRIEPLVVCAQHVVDLADDKVKSAALCPRA
jgi:hypothetical protein